MAALRRHPRNFMVVLGARHGRKRPWLSLPGVRPELRGQHAGRAEVRGLERPDARLRRRAVRHPGLRRALRPDRPAAGLHVRRAGRASRSPSRSSGWSAPGNGSGSPWPSSWRARWSRPRCSDRRPPISPNSSRRSAASRASLSRASWARCLPAARAVPRHGAGGLGRRRLVAGRVLRDRALRRSPRSPSGAAPRPTRKIFPSTTPLTPRSRPRRCRCGPERRPRQRKWRRILVLPQRELPEIVVERRQHEVFQPGIGHSAIRARISAGLPSR